jgi:hypothetical protein
MNPIVEAWIVIEKLGALCATPGISEDVQKEANALIDSLLKTVVKTGLDKLVAKDSGLIL